MLRNPQVYFEYNGVARLPRSLQAEWQALNLAGDEVAHASGFGQDWAAGTPGISKLQAMVRDGKVTVAVRNDVARLLERASDVFARSTGFDPGNTSYYAGNLGAAISPIRGELSMESRRSSVPQLD